MRHPPVWGRGSLHILRLKYFLACGWRPHLKLPPSSCSPYMGRSSFRSPVHGPWRHFVVIQLAAMFSPSGRLSHKCHSSQLWCSHSLHFFGSVSTFIIIFFVLLLLFLSLILLRSIFKIACNEWSFLFCQARKSWYFPLTNGPPSSHPVQNHFLWPFIWDAHNLTVCLEILQPCDSVSHKLDNLVSWSLLVCNCICLLSPRPVDLSFPPSLSSLPPFLSLMSCMVCIFHFQIPSSYFLNTFSVYIFFTIIFISFLNLNYILLSIYKPRDYQIDYQFPLGALFQSFSLTPKNSPLFLLLPAPHSILVKPAGPRQVPQQ